jgi:hypothetical protein
MKKSKFSALTLAALGARTILSAATINPFSLARVASKIKFPSVQFQRRHYREVFGRPYFGDSFSAKRRCFNDNSRIK